MDAHQRAGALAIQVQIADMKFVARAIQFRFVARVDRASQAELRVVGDAQSVVVIIRFDDRQHRTKYFFLLDRRSRPSRQR